MQRFIKICVGAVVMICTVPSCLASPLAQEYRVSIRQVSPDGAVSEALCLVSGEGDTCFMTAEIRPLSGEDTQAGGFLDVGMRFSAGNVNFNFMWNREYAFTKTYEMREKGVDVPLDAAGHGRGEAFLMTRSLLQQSDPEGSIVWRTPLPLAQIEMRVTRARER